MPTLDHRENFNVLHVPHGLMFQDYMRRLTESVLAEHSYPRTLQEWQAQRARVREGLLASMGELPAEHCDLDPRVVQVLPREGYVIEKVRLRTRPEWQVGALLYRPVAQDRPLPGIICPHGHWPTGKTARAVQLRCINFALRGYVALALDMCGYGERSFQGHQDQFPLLTVGMTLAGLQLYDNMRCLDYLCSRPEVEAARIGCTGASGGGNQTTYLSALDERIQASAPVCSVELYEDYFQKGFCVCETLPRIIQVGDQPHVLGLVAPRALLLVNATLDAGFPILKARQALDRLKLIYRLYGMEHAVELHEVYADHSYDENARLGVYRWFDRWLKGAEESEYHEEPQWIEPEDGKSLWVGGLESLTVPQLTYRRVTATLASQVPAPPTEAKAALVSHCLGGLPEPEVPPRGVSVEVMDRGPHTVEKLAIRTEPDILVTGLLIKPQPAPAQMPVCLYMLPQGKGDAVLLHGVGDILKAGWAVCALEPRLVGETQVGSPQPLEYRSRWTIVYGRLLAGMQAFDVMRAADYLLARPDIASDRLAVWGQGPMAFIALLAGVLDQRFTHTGCYELLASYAHEHQIRQATSHFLFDVIAHVGDICDIAALVAPRRLMIASPLDGSLEPACPQTSFARTLEAYQGLGAADALCFVGEGYDEMSTAWVALLGVPFSPAGPPCDG